MATAPTTIETVRRQRRNALRFALAAATLIPLAVVVVGIFRQGLPFEAQPPPADAEPGRWMVLDGAQNTRDLGGYATADGRHVRRGLVFRSATLSHLTDLGCAAFEQLGVNTVVDLRNRLMALPLYNGDVLCVHLAASVFGRPVSFRSEGPREQRYLQGLHENADAFRDIFELLAEPQRLPLMYHCTAGTDRTGVESALLLTLLGVDRETVLRDFRLSEQVGTPGNLPAMEYLLNAVDAAGGIEPFLEQLGVARETQAQVKEALLE